MESELIIQNSKMEAQWSHGKALDMQSIGRTFNSYRDKAA